MFKAIIRFVVTAVLCIGFYALGQMPGAPSVSDVYDWGKTVVERIQSGQAAEVADETFAAGKQMVAAELFSNNIISDNDKTISDNTASKPAAVQTQYAPKITVTQRAESSMPKCW